MCAPDAPPPPDYAAAAQQQGQENVYSTIANSILNRPTEQTPYGTRNWTQTGSTQVGPYAIPNYTSSIDYTPEGRALFDQQSRISSNLGSIAEGGLQRVGDSMGSQFDMSGLPTRQLGINTNGLPGVSGPDFSGAPARGSFDTSTNLGRLNLSGLPGRTVAPTVAGTEAVTQALLDRQAPMRAQRAEKLQSDLVNSGFSRGTEAYDREMLKLGATENDERLAAIQAGGAEQSRLFGMESSARQQAQGEQQAQFDSGMTAYNSDTARAQAGFNAENTNRQNSVAEAMAQSQFGAQNRAQQFGEQTAQFNAGQQSRQQGISEEAYLRSLPLAELNSLRTGAQPTAPQFQNYSPVQGPNPAPYFAATQAQGNAAQQQYQNDTAASNNMMSGLFSVGASLAGAPVGAAGVPWWMPKS